MALIGLLAALFPACAQKRAPLNSPPDLQLTETDFVKITNNFSFELFKQINQVRPDSNLFISPFSVSMALGMALNGAEGNTFEQIKTVLGFENYDLESIDQIYKNYFSRLKDIDSRVIFEIANSVWYAQSFNILPSFLLTNQQYFNAQVYGADFADPATLTAINNWVKQKTHQKIEKILNYIPRQAVLYLLNALYFKGIWQYAFDPDETRDWWFKHEPQQQTSCKMMFLTRKLAHLKSAQFEMVQLPYGNGRFNMAIILPNPDRKIDDLIANLNISDWQSYLNQCRIDSGTVGLPRLKMGFEMVLNDLLKNMGMPDAFSPTKADFSKITNESGIYISLVKHKTFVEINEEGTEAAAVTIVGFDRSVSGLFNMIADHPFLFIIYEKESQAILFMGKVIEPEL